MSLITSPTEEPITLTQAKAHLRVEHSDDDTEITAIIKAARKYTENACTSSIVRQQRRLYLDSFQEVMLPYGPVQNIQQVQYIDSDGATQTLSSSVYDFNADDQTLRLAYDQSWPDTRAQSNAVWVDYWAGYFDDTVSPVDLQSSVPEDLRFAMYLLIADLYENREMQLDMAVYQNRAFNMLIGSYRTYLQ